MMIILLNVTIILPFNGRLFSAVRESDGYKTATESLSDDIDPTAIVGRKPIRVRVLQWLRALISQSTE